MVKTEPWEKILQWSGKIIPVLLFIKILLFPLWAYKPTKDRKDADAVYAVIWPIKIPFKAKFSSINNFMSVKQM